MTYAKKPDAFAGIQGTASAFWYDEHPGGRYELRVARDLDTDCFTVFQENPG